MTCTKERFLSDVANHQMTVLRDDGIYRHVRFRNPASSAMYFDLITWPGCLCYTGDMGTYVFERLKDMFEFFRSPGELAINRSYWAEKVQAQDTRDPIKEYSPDVFRACIREWLDDEEVFDEVRQEVEDQVLAHAEDGEAIARTAAEDFEHGGHQLFTDFWEVDLTEYTFRYTWCCFAIVWGIQQYDRSRAPGIEPDEMTQAAMEGRV